MTLAIRRAMQWGSPARLGSLTMALGGGGLDAVLVDDPFEGGAVAEAVVEGGGGDAVEGGCLTGWFRRIAVGSEVGGRRREMSFLRLPLSVLR